MRSWSNEILLGRPPQEDRRRRGAWNVQVRDRPSLRGEPLFGQTLRHDGQQLGVPRSQEEARQGFESGREHQKAFERGHEGAPRRDHRPEDPLPGERHVEASELLDRLASVEAPRVEPKKRSVGASERDEWLRAAWRVMVSAQVDRERGWCSWMRWGPILRFLPSTLGRQK